MAVEKKSKIKNYELKPVALILAGFDKIDSETKRRRKKELVGAYDAGELYYGQNKFLYTLAGKPVIQYVIDAAYNARKDGERIYDKIYIYNDIQSFKEQIDVNQYPNLVLNEMTDSVAGHWKDFYFKYIDYGQHVDVFFGDTPRITSKDVEYIHGEYCKILDNEEDHRGVGINMIFCVAEYEDMKDDDWFKHMIKFIKVGANKGKLKSFVGFEKYQVRVGNAGSLVKYKGIDGLLEKEASNLIYNLRKALSPRILSKILFYIWRTKRFDMIRQIKNKCIIETEIIDTFIDVMQMLYKIDLSGFGFKMNRIKKNAARWENDIDGPRDFKIFQKRFEDNG